MRCVELQACLILSLPLSSPYLSLCLLAIAGGVQKLSTLILDELRELRHHRRRARLALLRRMPLLRHPRNLLPRIRQRRLQLERTLLLLLLLLLHTRLRMLGPARLIFLERRHALPEVCVCVRQ